MSGIVSICAAPGWWLLLGTHGSWQRRPLVGWALLDDGRVAGLTDWLSEDEPLVVDDGIYRHDIDWRPCSCPEPSPHSGGFDPRFCIECSGVLA
jgi:hypothetical protein